MPVSLRVLFIDRDDFAALQANMARPISRPIACGEGVYAYEVHHGRLARSGVVLCVWERAADGRDAVRRWGHESTDSL